MPPRPFPYPFSIGTDIIQVKRIHTILLRARNKPEHRQRFLRRFLTPGEVLEFQTRFSDISKGSEAHLSLISKHLAGRCVFRLCGSIIFGLSLEVSHAPHSNCCHRWAAKEAAIKAVTWRRLSFHDVIVQRVQDEAGVRAVILDEMPLAPKLDVSQVYKACNGGCETDAAPMERRSTVQQTAGLHAEPPMAVEGQIAKISISHDGDYATAVCLAVEGR